MQFKDHFSAHADLYRDARPTYPDALFEWLAQTAPATRLAWDAGCGNGQASGALAAHFEQVFATDPSATQIAAAPPYARVTYGVEPAEHSALADASVDLVTVAQALHWFDAPSFFTEVRRVLVPGGLIAVWTYADCHIEPAVDALKDRLYVDLVGPYWPPERRQVENGYADLAFPFDELAAPPFQMRARWSAPQFLAYLRSWSASQRYLKERGHDAVTLIEAELSAAWGDQPRAVSWSLALRCGRT